MLMPVKDLHTIEMECEGTKESPHSRTTVVFDLHGPLDHLKCHCGIKFESLRDTMAGFKAFYQTAKETGVRFRFADNSEPEPHNKKDEAKLFTKRRVGE